jgi:poly(3-hydroxybutyrate) depolymerase
MNPDRHLKSHYDYFKDLIKGDNSSVDSHREFYDEYNAVLDMDADYYLETITTVFQDFKLVRGTWEVKNPQGQLELVRPQDIRTTALLTVEGELDDISGSGQTEAAHKLCSGIVRKEQHHLEAKGAGHYGIFSGRRWRDVVYPHVKSFILAHNNAKNLVKSVAVKPKAVTQQAAPAAKKKTNVAAKTAPIAKKATAKRVAKKTPAQPK